jgi:hypothetical protein
MNKRALAGLLTAFISLFDTVAFSQSIKIVNAAGRGADIRIGSEFRKSAWNIDPAINPDVMDVYVQKVGKPVTFITDKDSIQFEVKPGDYHALKMDAYAFEFQNEKIVQSNTYDRIGFSDSNFLRSFIPALQAFAIKSRFADFYAKHLPYYDGLITSYRDSIGVREMQKWLTVNFPSAKYDSFKIIFSPLVYENQSASRFEFDGFQEAQAHVNFPFHGTNEPKTFSKEASLVQDGSILFTELNHAFINPESEKPHYAERIAKAFANMATWNNPEKPAKYYESPYASFNEYMNWALVCLRYVDYAPKNEQARLIAQTENMMVNSRGFIKFAEFDQFLVKLYQNRKNGQVLADLYPEIVGWFEANK